MTDRFAGKADWFDSHYESTRGRVRLSLVLERLRSGLPTPPARILDAGGGTGAFAIPLAKDGYDVTLLDASAEWIQLASEKALGPASPWRAFLGRSRMRPMQCNPRSMRSCVMPS